MLHFSYMYQLVVLGLACTLLLGGAYYIKSADGSGILSQAIISPSYRITEDMIPGVYVCDASSGCTNVATLTLKDTGDVVLVSGSDAEAIEETGTWQFVKGQLVSISLTAQKDTIYDVPHTLLVQSVGTSTLTKISYNSNLFPGIYKPTFTKQSEGVE